MATFSAMWQEPEGQLTVSASSPAKLADLLERLGRRQLAEQLRAAIKKEA